MMINTSPVRMTVYRFYVGLIGKDGSQIDRASVLSLADGMLDGYTAYDANGRWAGTSEPSIVIEYLGTLANPQAIAWMLATGANQSSVMLSTSPVTLESIDGAPSHETVSSALGDGFRASRASVIDARDSRGLQE